MTRRKQGLGLFGLLAVAVLGVMALASSAQAAEPKFAVNGVVPAENVNVTGTQEGSGILLVPASNLDLKCTEFEVLEGVILAGGTVGHARLLYKNCTALENKKPNELPCHVSDVDTVNPSFLHVTVLKATLLPVEIAAGVYGVLAEGLTVQVNFLSGTGCPLPLKNVVKGEVCFKITAGNETTAPLIKSDETIQTECPKKFLLESLLAKEDEEIANGIHKGTPTIEDKLLFGANPAFVDGSATLSSGTNTIGVLLF